MTICENCKFGYAIPSECLRKTGVCRECRERAAIPDERPAAAGAGGGHPEYLKLLDEMRALHARKAADYGRGVDPLANVRSAAEFGVPAWVGVIIRANDKMHRIKSFLQNGSLKNEGVEDSLKDLAAYALIALVLYREGQTETTE